MDRSCERVEYAVVDSRQGVVLQLAVLGEGLTTQRKKKKLVAKCYTGPWNWWALVNTVMNLRVSQGEGDFLTS
jgi:hypothetical protein